MGRPLEYKSQEELESKVDEYFNQCDKNIIKKQHVTGKGITIVETPEPYTVAGLADHLGVTRETLCEWQKNNDKPFSDTITRAKQKIERYNITYSMAGCYDSRIAALNLSSNFGYSDKKETKDITDHTDGWTPEEVQELKTLAEELAKKSRDKTSKVTDIKSKQAVSE
jgi:transcriptional regulator with XRE-family HTH domain